VAGVVICEIPSFVAIAHDEELEETGEGLGVDLSGIVLVFDDLLQGPVRVNSEGLQLDLHDRHAVDQEDDIVTVVALVGV